jgi:hypothetical protein
MVEAVGAGLAVNRGNTLPAQWPTYSERSAARKSTSNSAITVPWVNNSGRSLLSVRRSRGTSLLWSGGQRKPGMAKPGVREDGRREL